MTIAVGMLTLGGVAIAADNQSIAAENHEVIPGHAEIAQGKIHAHSQTRGPTTSGSLLSAVGDAVYCDVLMQRLHHEFVKNDTLTDRDALDQLFAQTVKQFSVDVTQFVSNQVESPDVNVLIATQRNGVSGLWTAEKSAVARHEQFAAIGIGGSCATGLLATLWHPKHDVRLAAILAAYVIFQVKKSVDGCGADTEVMYLKDNRFHALSVDQVRGIEKLFRFYSTELEPTVVQYVLGARSPTGKLVSSALRSLRRKSVKAVGRLAGTNRGHW